MRAAVPPTNSSTAHGVGARSDQARISLPSHPPRAAAACSPTAVLFSTSVPSMSVRPTVKGYR